MGSLGLVGILGAETSTERRLTLWEVWVDPGGLFPRAIYSSFTML